MENIPLSQNELKLLLALINVAVQKGGLQLGDLFSVLPLVKKLDDKLVKPEPEKVEKAEEGKVVKSN